MLISGVAVDLNWFFQLILTLFIVAFGLLHIVKNTASKYFVVDANFDDSSPPSSLSDSTDADAPSTAAGDLSMPGVLNDSCAVCGSATTKQCSGCKKVKYCSQACQRSHWNSEHRQKCKDYQLSGKLNSSKSLFALRESKSLAYGTSNILKESRRILFPYEEFLELYNWEAPGFPPCGLFNTGNSCFANVVLQCLAHTRPLVAYMLEKGHRSKCRRNDWCFLCEFQNHVGRVSQTTRPFTPDNILSRLSNISGNLGYGKQEDAHEFMRMVIDAMQSACLDDFGGEKIVHPSSQGTTLIQHIFGGYLQSQVICTKCNNVSNQFENMMDLTVEIQGDAASLEECLDQFTAKEQLHGDNMYKCDGCNDYVMAWKRLTVRRAPNILTIALKRFQSGRFGKLNKRVTFPVTLDLRPYMSEAGDGNDVYKLYAVVVHVDMLNASFFGHYICYTKDFRGNWYRIDDCKVCGVELDEVLSQGAYMLLYSRVCARPSCLYPAEPVSKEERGTEGIAEKMDFSCKKPIDNFSAAVLTIMAGPSESLLSDGKVQLSSSREELSSDDNSEDASEDVDVVDSEACTSASNEIIICANGDSNADQETFDFMKNDRMVSGVTSLADTNSTEVHGQKFKPPSMFLNVPNGCGDNNSYLREELMMDFSTADSMETKNCVSENMMPLDAAFSAPRAVRILEYANYVNSECKPELGKAGKDLPPSSLVEDAEKKLNGRNSSAAKLKPLFTDGFLEKPPQNKIIKRDAKPPAQRSNLPFNVLSPSNGKVIISHQNGVGIQDGEKLGHAYSCSSCTSFLGTQSAESHNEDLMDTSESDVSVGLGNGGSGIPMVTDDNINTVIEDGRPLEVEQSLTCNGNSC